METTLRGTGPYRVVAPDYNAFTASGITAATLSSLTEIQVKNILLYHTIESKIPASVVPAAPYARVITAGGDAVFVTSNSGVVYINGIKLSRADIAADNNVIHS